MLHNPRPKVSIRCEILDGNPKAKITSDMTFSVIVKTLQTFVVFIYYWRSILMEI